MVWLGKPGRRQEFNKRDNSNWLANLAELFVLALWGGAAWLAAGRQPWALIPLALAVLLTLPLRRRAPRYAPA